MWKSESNVCHNPTRALIIILSSRPPEPQGQQGQLPLLPFWTQGQGGKQGQKCLFCEMNEMFWFSQDIFSNIENNVSLNLKYHLKSRFYSFMLMHYLKKRYYFSIYGNLGNWACCLIKRAGGARNFLTFKMPFEIEKVPFCLALLLLPWNGSGGLDCHNCNHKQDKYINSTNFELTKSFNSWKFAIPA